MSLKSLAVRAAAVALIAGGGIAVATGTAMAENGGSPGAGIAPMGEGEAWSGSIAPMDENDWNFAPVDENDWNFAPRGEGSGAPGGAGVAPAYDDNDDGTYDHVAG